MEDNKTIEWRVRLFEGNSIIATHIHESGRYMVYSLYEPIGRIMSYLVRPILHGKNGKRYIVDVLLRVKEFNDIDSFEEGLSLLNSRIDDSVVTFEQYEDGRFDCDITWPTYDFYISYRKEVPELSDVYISSLDYYKKCDAAMVDMDTIEIYGDKCNVVFINNDDPSSSYEKTVRVKEVI